MLATAALTDPCGRFLPALVVHDLHDRLRGRSRRARARWGRLDRPPAPGRLVWIVSGAARTSVRLGVELTRALIARRLDISVLFTYEAEHSDLLAPLADCPRTAWGYGPADYVGSMYAVWRRLLPFGIVVAGVAPRPNLLMLCEASRHALLVAPPVPVEGRFERIYPTHAAPCPGRTSAPQAEFDVLLNARAGVAAAAAIGATRLWGWHGSDPAAAKRLFALFRGHLPHDVLVVGGPACAGLPPACEGLLRLSGWDETPLDPATLVAADHADGFRALAPALCAAHFAVPDTDALWRALGAGAVVSVPSDRELASARLRAAVVRADDENALVAAWSALAADPALHERAMQASRRAHAAEQRAAAANASELIERVCRWQ